ncbi:MAG: hypothetical protein LUI87_10890 [Lachnospiraceae bacterium]|nr:hypothetical protein [Lachnospiraceae bacterium]
MKMDFEDITLRIKSIGKDTVAEVQKVTEVRQYRSQISAEKKRINAIYTEIGKKLYDAHRETPPEGFEAEFHSLKVAFDTIEELQGHIRTAKGVALCPNCRMEVGMYERFCSNCGCKMPEVITIEGEEPEEIPFVDQPQAGGQKEESVPEETAAEAKTEQDEPEKAAPAMETGQGEPEETAPEGAATEAEAEQGEPEETAAVAESEPDAALKPTAAQDEKQSGEIAENDAAQESRCCTEELMTGLMGSEEMAASAAKNEEPTETAAKSEAKPEDSAEAMPDSEDSEDTQTPEEA